MADRIKCSAMTAGCEFDAIHPRLGGSLAFPTAMALYSLFRQKLERDRDRDQNQYYVKHFTLQLKQDWDHS